MRISSLYNRGGELNWDDRKNEQDVLNTRTAICQTHCQMTIVRNRKDYDSRATSKCQ